LPGGAHREQWEGRRGEGGLPKEEVEGAPVAHRRGDESERQF
jgi:hypothetical protein